jgi:hypothetical protein
MLRSHPVPAPEACQFGCPVGMNSEPILHCRGRRSPVNTCFMVFMPIHPYERSRLYIFRVCNQGSAER